VELKRRVNFFSQMAVGELEHLVRLAIGKRKLLTLHMDALRPTRVVKSLLKQRNQERLSVNFQNAQVTATAPGPLPPGAYPANPVQPAPGLTPVPDQTVKSMVDPAPGLEPAGTGNADETKLEVTEEKQVADASNYKTAGKENINLGNSQKPSEHAGKQDVSVLVKELMLAFPNGLRFTHLKHHLKEVNGGVFNENAFFCSSLPSISETMTEKGNEVSAVVPPGRIGKKGGASASQGTWRGPSTATKMQ